MKHGINSPRITSILEDSRGNLWFGTWFGTAGVCKYDGTSFTHFTQKEGLSNNFITSILEDRNGNLWFGTFGGGLSMYNGESFTHFTEKEGLSNNKVGPIMEDSHGNLWIGTSGRGVSMYNGKSFTHFTKKEGLSNNFVLSILEDRNGNLWFGTRGSGVSMYNGTSFTHFTKNEGLSSNYVYSILEDRHDNLWFGTYGGVSMYNGKSLPTRQASFTHFTEKDGLSNNIVRSILEDSHGNLWFGTWGGGVSMYNGTSFTHFTEKEGLSSNYIRSILEDSYGNFWFATDLGGVSIYNGESFIHFTEKDNHVISLLEDRNCNLWFGANNGVSMYNDTSFTYFTEKECFGRSALSILEDRNGNLWFGYTDGVRMYNGESVTHFTEKEGFVNNYIMSILEDRQGNLWFATWGDGVCMYNGNTVPAGQASFIHFTEKEGLSNNIVLSILEDRYGNLWFGTLGGGVCMYNGNTVPAGQASFTHFTEKEGMSINSIGPIMEDSHGNLWFGTLGRGVSMYNGKNFTHFTEKEGLIFNYVSSILEDRENNIWLGTDRGLNRLVFGPESVSGSMNSLSASGMKEDSVKSTFYNPVIHTYSEQDGLVDMVFQFNTVLLDCKNRIWWGTFKGLTMLDMNSFKIPVKPPATMQLNQIEINGQFADFRHLKESAHKGLEFNGVASFYNYPLNLELPYNCNHLSFYFSAIDWAAPHKLSYQYMLEGFDKEWGQLTGENKAIYRKIPPGSYTFKVRAIGVANIWSDTMEYSFIVHPPWYRTFLAWFIYGLLLLALIFSFIRWRTWQLRRDKEQLEKQVKDRTHKIEERDFHILEMDRMKTRFFANISHEFRTPLTLILSPLEELIINNSLGGKVRERLNAIRRNGLRLLDLVNQLLDLSKLDSGKLKLELAEADMIKTLRLTFSSFISLADKKRIQYIFKLPDGELITYFDRSKLETIMNNLLSNAFKYTPEDGEIECNVQIRQAGKEVKKNTIEISVKDSGPGIAKNKLELIFDRFYQADEQHRIEGGGTGIGLSLTKELVHLIHGQINVRSKPGEGSCFKLSIPLGKDHLKKSEYVIVETDTSTERRLPGKTLLEEKFDDVSDDKPITGKKDTRVLIVEDNYELRSYLIEQLQSEYMLEEATNGEEGLKEAIKSIPDLIISDIMMPKMDGIEFCRRIKTNERTSHIPVILLTAKADTQSRIEGLETGADDYIIKPFDIQELKVRVKNLVEQRRQLRQRFANNFNVSMKEIAFNSYDVQFMDRVMKLVKDHLADFDFDVKELHGKAGMSHTQLYRKLYALTGMSPSRFIRNIRCKFAAKLMQQKYGSVTQIAYKAGFNNLSWFGKSFKEQYGVSPSEYGKQFSE